MEEEELELAVCADCGATIDLDAERCFLLSDDDVLCFDCALRRGGQYDEMADEWRVAPDAAGLPDERRPHP